MDYERMTAPCGLPCFNDSPHPYVLDSNSRKTQRNNNLYESRMIIDIDLGVR